MRLYLPMMKISQLWPLCILSKSIHSSFLLKLLLTSKLKTFLIMWHERGLTVPQEMNQVERFIGPVLSKIHNQIIFLQRIKQPDFCQGDQCTDPTVTQNIFNYKLKVLFFLQNINFIFSNKEGIGKI